MPAELTRDRLVTAVLAFLSSRDLLTVDQIRASLEQEIDSAGPGALVALMDQLTADAGWTYYPPSPLVAKIHYLLAGHFLGGESRVSGTEHLDAVGADPVMIFANHLSYADANVIQVLLHRAGHQVLAGRLTALAGPKVFTSRERRFSSLCFGTIKVPQSADVSSEEAILNAREVARAARRAIAVAAERLNAGDALLLFGEGTRSRAAQMQRMLPAVARYVEAVPGAWVLPVGLVGSEALFPVGDVTIRPARVELNIGAPLRADELTARNDRHRQAAVDAIGQMIAALLPASYRGAY